MTTFFPDNFTAETANTTARSSIGFYHYREPKLVRAEDDPIPAESNVDSITQKTNFTLSLHNFTTQSPLARFSTHRNFLSTSQRFGSKTPLKFSSTTPSSVSQTSDPFVDNTPWSFPMLPEGRNLDSDAIGLALNNGSEYDTSHKWTAFTVPHSQLPQFLLSTIPSLINSETLLPPVSGRPNGAPPPQDITRLMRRPDRPSVMSVWQPLPFLLSWTSLPWH